MNKEFEILAPAGSLEILKAVILAGADAVYLGGEQYGARAYANNFTREELIEGLHFAHLRDKSVYLTINTLMKNQEIGKPLFDYLLPFYENGLDAVIVQDFGAMAFVKRCFPDLAIHCSTQMTVTSYEGARFLKELGATRVVTSRELSLAEIKRIHEEVAVEIETFVHGALCYCYSGQCLFSSMLGGRSGNRGRCAQPCRLSYEVYDTKRKQIKSESFVLSPKDLCGIKHLKEMHEAGIFSLKIEGRMKKEQYAAGVTQMYRKYVDLYLKNAKKCEVSEKDWKHIMDLGNRCGFTDAYFTKQNGPDMITFLKPSHEKAKELEHTEKEASKLETNGYLFLSSQEECCFTLVCGEHSVTVTAPAATIAQNKPLLQEEVDARMRKTGDTPFALQDLQIDMESNLFMPVKDLNQLRRDGFTLLERELLQEHVRSQASYVPFNRMPDDANTSSEKAITWIAYIENEEQLKPILSSKIISDIYVDCSVMTRENFIPLLRKLSNQVHESGKRIFLALPTIFRVRTQAFYEGLWGEIIPLIDGLLLRNYEELQWCKERNVTLPVVLDHNLYTYNDESSYAFLQSGYAHHTMPLELNAKEIKNRDNRGTQMLVYGYYPLMTTAQCVHHNVIKCDKNRTIHYLKDRYQKLFPVKNYCDACYNVIYNSLPVMLFKQLDTICNAGVKELRLQFTLESEQEVALMMDALDRKEYDMPFLKDYTNGHFKRGVE